MIVRQSVADILENHVTFELECIDRMYLNAYVPSLQSGELTRRGAGLGEVADQADADTVLVEIVVGGLAVGAVFLLVPP